MNRSEIVRYVKDKADVSKVVSDKVVATFFDSITQALAKGDRVEIRGFCSFFIKEYDGYTGRNPKTGEKIYVDSKKLPFFKCGKELKERVDNK
jgi:integration host factor subunit beta